MFAVAGFLCLALSPRQSQTDSAGQRLFTQYQAGQNISSEALALPPRSLIREIESAAPPWPRKTTAAFVLEVAAAWMDESDESSEPAVQLLEFGCELIRGSEQSPFEREWHLAALAVLTGPMSDRFDRHRAPVGRGASEHYHRHAAGRYPDDPELRLIWGRNREVIALNRIYGWGRTMRFDSAGAVPGSQLEVRAVLGEAAAAFRGVLTSPAFGAEAKTRLGLMSMYLGHRHEARRMWRDVAESAADDRWRYLSSLFLARSLAAEQEWQDAHKALLMATAINQEAGSARVLLAAVQFAQGERRGFSAVPYGVPDRDPWLTYRDLQPRLRLSALQQAIR